jgi:hypothetical protein
MSKSDEEGKKKEDLEPGQSPPAEDLASLNLRLAKAGDEHPSLQLKDHWSIMLENGTLVAKD